ncbi:unnamed protein product [Hydatigera taeniaeformis]|uniref:Uncharacterized protein n=1 Tax=Hydatigena taeniaeformis TaxID=6205 RepID=A0A0R3WI49_HYDTA|nr:unnamed protein product [Hydatigera taeniaeformis]
MSDFIGGRVGWRHIELVQTGNNGSASCLIVICKSPTSIFRLEGAMRAVVSTLCCRGTAPVLCDVDRTAVWQVSKGEQPGRWAQLTTPTITYLSMLQCLIWSAHMHNISLFCMADLLSNVKSHGQEDKECSSLNAPKISRDWDGLCEEMQYAKNAADTISDDSNKA